MKQYIKFLGIAAAAALMFSACAKDSIEREASPKDTNALQAYVYQNTSDITIKPSDKGFNVTWGEGSFDSAEKKFPIVFGRHIDTDAQKAAASFKVKIIDEKEAFSCAAEEMISFAQGETCDTLWVSTSLDFGKSATLVIEIPQEYRSTYGGQAETEVKVSVDYTWIDRGKVTFTSGTFGLEGDVSIQCAKEYKNGTDSLFRLVSPLYTISKGEEVEPGVKVDESVGAVFEEGAHLKIVLDKDYKFIKFDAAVKNKAVLIPYGVYDSGGDLDIFWSDGTAQYSSYCVVASQNNTFSFQYLLYQGGSLYGPYTEQFVWTTGCPESISLNPKEHDGEIQKLAFSKGQIGIVRVGGKMDQIVNILDPVMFANGVDGSYELSVRAYIILLDNSGNGIQFEAALPVDLNTGSFIVPGEYKVGTSDDTAPRTLYPGLWNGSTVTGSYAIFGGGAISHFVESGKLTITANGASSYKVEVDCVTAGGKITGTYTGTLPMGYAN